MKREETGHNHNQIKAKPNSVYHSNDKIWDSLRSSGYLQRAWGTSQAPPSTIHKACLLDTGMFHSMAAAILGRHLMILVSPKCPGLLWQLDCTSTSSFTNTVSGSVFWFWFKASAFFHDHFNNSRASTANSTFTNDLSHSQASMTSFMLSKPVSPVILILTSSAPGQDTIMVTSGTHLLCADTKKTLH